MSVVYVVIGRGSTVLAEYRHSGKDAHFQGNFETIGIKLLQKIEAQSPRPETSSYVFDSASAPEIPNAKKNGDDSRFAFHVVSLPDNLICLSLCSLDFQRELAVEMLHEISRNFVSNVGVRWKHASAYELQKDYEKSLISIVERFQHNHRANAAHKPISVVKGQISDLKVIIEDNIECALIRGAKISDLMDSSDALVDSGTTFRKKSQAIKRRMWWKHKKVLLMLALTLIGCAYIATAIGCGGLGLPNCV
eukprot:TRINITY_DN33075_c0_g1_i1.p1 TRINITY_DN33075_c0_g1~~TRINITY_DN33075_c0_g1_i1.p1  ORF type:complete len:250 (+),score=25.18 TRINITY_DN33075_c0_g1_i1:80-829(+)